MKYSNKNQGAAASSVLIIVAIVILLAGAGITAREIRQAGNEKIAQDDLNQLIDIPEDEMPAESNDNDVNEGMNDEAVMPNQDEATSSSRFLTEEQKQEIEEIFDERAKEINEQAEELDKELVTIFGRDYEFSRPVVRVKKGDNVKVIFTSVEGTHDFTLDEFDVRSKRVREGQGTSVEFTASEAGEFEFYSSIGNNRELGMVGTLIIEE